jgi:hypothetical protein
MPIGHTPTDKEVIGPIFVEPRIETPQFSARLSLQRHGSPEGVLLSRGFSTTSGIQNADGRVLPSLISPV